MKELDTKEIKKFLKILENLMKKINEKKQKLLNVETNSIEEFEKIEENLKKLDFFIHYYDKKVLTYMDLLKEEKTEKLRELISNEIALNRIEEINHFL